MRSGSDKYLSCVLHILAGDVMSVKLLEMWHVVKHVCSVVVQQTHWVWGSCGIIQHQFSQVGQMGQLCEFLFN